MLQKNLHVFSVCRTPVSACWQLSDVPWPTWGRYKVVGSLHWLCAPHLVYLRSALMRRSNLLFVLSSNAIWATVWSAATLKGTDGVGGLLPICGPRKRALILGLLCLSWGSGPPRGHSICCMGLGVGRTPRGEHSQGRLRSKPMPACHWQHAKATIHAHPAVTSMVQCPFRKVAWQPRAVTLLPLAVLRTLCASILSK